MGGSPLTSKDMNNFYSQNSHIKKATNAQQVFTSRYMNPLFNPATMKLPREACDSVTSPRSRGIILAEDVTGSMGVYLLSLFQTEFPSIINKIYDTVSFDPHIMFMGVGDVEGDDAPLQVTQFETDLRILEQLKQIWLERGGCGNGYESYIFPWYFAAKHTKMDCFDKRGEKGFLFTFGDEGPTPRLTSSDIYRVFGDNDKYDGPSLTPKECLEMASEKYYCYHIILRGDNYTRGRRDAWKNLMGGHACELTDHHCLPELVLAILSMYEGMSKTEAIEKIESSHAREVVAFALKDHEEKVDDEATSSENADIEVF